MVSGNDKQVIYHLILTEQIFSDFFELDGTFQKLQRVPPQQTVIISSKV